MILDEQANVTIFSRLGITNKIFVCGLGVCKSECVTVTAAKHSDLFHLHFAWAQNFLEVC